MSAPIARVQANFYNNNLFSLQRPTVRELDTVAFQLTSFHLYIKKVLIQALLDKVVSVLN
jgi:hypothetical protein